MQGSVFSRWLVVAALAFGALALALPALAEDGEKGHGNGHGNGHAYGHSKHDAEDGHGAPQAAEPDGAEQAPAQPEAQSSPPSKAKPPKSDWKSSKYEAKPPKHAPGHARREGGSREAAAAPYQAPAPQEAAREPQASEQPAAQPRRRVSVRSVRGTGRNERARRRDGSRPGRPRGSRPPAGKVRTDALSVYRRGPFRIAGDGSGAGAAAPVTSAPAAASAVGPSPSRVDGRRLSKVVVVAPPDPLPGRVIPDPVREIVEVVPDELWMALAALGLLALLLAVWSWIVALRARRLKRQRETLLQEVGLLQTALLPPVPAEVPATVAYRPADGPGAGGDFYDAFARADGTTGLIVGDVLGHGHEALAKTTLVRYTLRAYLEAGLEPREVIRTAGTALYDQLDTGFTTVTVAVFDPASARFTYASAGHHPPLVVGPGSHEPVTVCSSPPLGIGEPTGFRQSTFHLTAGSTVCIYTDGLTEARVGDEVLGRERLAELVEGLPADADADALLNRVAAATSATPDDMAACLIRAPADAPADGARIEELEVDEAEVGQSLEAFLRACGVPMGDVPGVLREAGEAARREGTATVRVRLNDFRPGVDVVPGNVVELDDKRLAARR